MSIDSQLYEFETAINASAKQIRGELDAMNRRLEGAITEIAQKSDGFRTMPGASSRSPLDELAKSSGLQNFVQDRSQKSVGVKLPGLVKSLVVGDVQSSTTNLIGVPAQFDPRLGDAGARRLSIFEILPSLAVSSNAFEFNQLDAYVNNAAYQSQEGATKASTSLPTTLVNAPICTIAHILPVSEQVMADMPALQQQVASLLTYGLRAKASAEIIAGNTAGKIQGLTAEGTVYTVSGGPNLPDAIAAAVSQLEISGWQASAILLNPADWLLIRTMRESAGTGQYLYGSPAAATAQTLWGIPVIADPSVPLDSPIVLDASQVAILDRQQAMVEFGRSQDDFETNTLRARAECRIGLAVFSPSAVLNVAIAS